MQLTGYAGRELYATFSPDGTQVAFAWSGERQDNIDIYVKKLVGASGPPLRLTTDPASDAFPAWSPDGRQIAFRRMLRSRDDATEYFASLRPAGTVMVMPALGGPERKVADVPRSRCPTLSWTSDGRWLATPAADSPGGNGIFLFPVEQGEPKRLTANPTSGDLCPPLSPDGRFLAYAACTYAACTSEYVCTIQVLELQPHLRPKAPPRRVAELSVGAAFEGLAWAADGRSLVYPRGYLYRLPLRGAPEAKRIDLAASLAVYPAISRARDRLAFTRGTTERDVWKLEQGHPPTAFLASSRLDQSPQLSPDGKRIT